MCQIFLPFLVNQQTLGDACFPFHSNRDTEALAESSVGRQGDRDKESAVFRFP